MKTLILALLATASFSALSQGRFGGCGLPPVPPVGMYYMCVCDSTGSNCNFVLVSKN